jgi:hypothetical protein
MRKIAHKANVAAAQLTDLSPKEQRSVEDLVVEFNRLVTDEASNLWRLEEIVAHIEHEFGDRRKAEFYDGVGLDPKGSTVRKFKKCGEQHPRFTPYKDKMPTALGTRYTLATMSDADFDKVATSGILRPFVTLQEILDLIPAAVKKRKPKLNVLLDVYKVPDPGRQRELVRKLKQLGDEYNVPLSAPGDKNALAAMIEELEREQETRAA